MPTGSRILGTIRLLAFLIMALVAGFCQALIISIPAIRKRHEHRIPVLFHGLSCQIFGIEIEVTGTALTRHPVLFVANHSSYIDISVIGSLIPGCFIAKAEVADWPLFGILAKLQRSVFVRRKREDVQEQRENMVDRVKDGLNLILFPEGTSSDGLHCLPFKSSLFSIAAMSLGGAEQRKELTVQPVTIACTRLDGVPLGRDLSHIYCWYGDMSLLPHLWRLGTLGHCTVKVVFLDPIPAAGISRKQLAQRAEDAVRDMLARINAGLPVEGYDPAKEAPVALAQAPAA
jgi:lyso-ornithine lipid O-acyltransferase